MAVSSWYSKHNFHSTVLCVYRGRCVLFKCPVCVTADENLDIKAFMLELIQIKFIVQCVYKTDILQILELDLMCVQCINLIWFVYLS